MSQGICRQGRISSALAAPSMKALGNNSIEHLTYLQPWLPPSVDVICDVLPCSSALTNKCSGCIVSVDVVDIMCVREVVETV